MNEYINKPCSELCPFIDIETLKFKSDYYLLSFNDTKNLVRYRYNMSVKQYDIFQKYEESLFKQFLELIKVKEDKPIFIFSYESIWNVCELGRYSNIYIKNGVIKTDEIKNIELVFKKALQYKAFPVFYNDSLKIVIIPSGVTHVRMCVWRAGM